MTIGYTVPLKLSFSLSAPLSFVRLPIKLPTPFASVVPACCTRSDIDGLRAGVVDVLDED